MKTEGIPKWIAVGATVIGLLGAAGAALFQVSTHEERIVSLDGRVDVVEEELNKIDNRHSKEDERWLNAGVAFDRLEKNQGKTNEKLDRLLERTP